MLKALSRGKCTIPQICIHITLTFNIHMYLELYMVTYSTMYSVYLILLVGHKLFYMPCTSMLPIDHSNINISQRSLKLEEVKIQLSCQNILMQFPSHIWLNAFQSIMLGISDSSLPYHPINQTQMITSVSYVNVLSFPYTHEKKLWSTKLSKTVLLFYLHHYNYPETKTLTGQYFYNISRLCY